tara:strand:- start:321 stop:593 length:273 start_codon:yes stop_codon:yes gene_type:complete
MNNGIKGDKHICSNCGTKFFDLNKTKILCPKCNIEVLNKKTSDNLAVISKKDKTNVDTEIDDKIVDNVEQDNIDEDMDTEDDTSTIIDID